MNVVPIQVQTLSLSARHVLEQMQQGLYRVDLDSLADTMMESLSGADRDSGYRDSGYRDSGYRDSGYRDSGYRDSGYRDSGYRESDDRESKEES